MWLRFVSWVKSIFKKSPEDGPETSYAEKYEDVTQENVTATISNKLASKVFGDSTFDIVGEGRRADFLRDVLRPFFAEDASWITAQTYGKGGMVIVPVVADGEVVLTAVNQERVYITARRGRRPVSATLQAESVMIDGKQYRRWMDYALDPTGLQTITTVVTDEGGAEVPFSCVPAWADIEPVITISNTDRLLLAFLYCPRDNRTERKAFGVPITFGADREVAEYAEHATIYSREYRLSRKMLGLDASLWSNKADMKATEVSDIGFVKRTVQDQEYPFIPIERARMSDKDQDWLVYSPEIRFDAMHGRKQDLAVDVENACGLSRGLLSDRPKIAYANRDEVRAVNYDTFCVVSDMRRALEAAFTDLAYAIDVYAERFGLTPAGARGSFELAFDWDLSMMESSTQTYQQLQEGRADKVISRAEHRQWLKGGTIEEAQKAIAEIDKEEPGLPQLFGMSDGGAAGGDANAV